MSPKNANQEAAMINKLRVFSVCTRWMIIFAGLILALPILILAAPGDLDLSFGSGGKVVTPIGSSNDFAQSVAMQSDGKIVAAGGSLNSANFEFAVVRYNTDGTLDTSFGGTGKVVTVVGSSSFAYAVAIQADGKIVVAGTSYTSANEDFTVVRYNADGSLDTSFGGTGKVVTQVGGSCDFASSVAIQADGKIVVAGQSYNGVGDCNAGTNFAVVRYNTNGTLDTTFNGTGKVVTPIGNGSSASSVAIQADGRIVAAGYSSSFGATYDFAVVRYNADGTLDTSFNGTGKVATPIGSSGDFARSVAIQSDGKIVAAGSSCNGVGNCNTGTNFAVVRYNPSGTLDTSFNGTGKVVTPIGSGNDYAASAAIQSDGKIVAAGGSRGTDFDFAVVRYNTNGTLDTSFNGTGRVVTPIGPNGNRANSVAIQSDGKIVAAGQSNNGLNHDFALVRYLTASNSVTVGGRVLTPGGLGLRNAIVSMVDSQGIRRTVTTSSFGFYSFENVSTGQTYTLTVSSRRYRFSARVTQVNGDLANVDFIGLE
ncbi:MAG: hypothetical protein WKF34_03380 [Pyrinomonadaceae bacterium]